MEYEKISAFSDEISETLEEQFQTLNKLNIKYFDPRGINGKNISTLTNEEVLELKKTMDQYGIKAASIGSPVGKIKLSDDFEAHFKMYQQIVQIAKLLECQYIRIFSFYHDGDDEWTDFEKTEVFNRLNRMITYAKEENVILIHENDKGVYGETKERCLEMMETLSGPNFKVVFDPANFVLCGQDIKETYEMLKPYIDYVHVKDARRTTGEVVPAGEGDGDLEYLLCSLLADGYDGFLSLEPHLGIFHEEVAVKMAAGTESFPKNNEKEFKKAQKALVDILARI